MRRPQQRGGTRRRTGVAVAAGLVSLSALGGVVGLVGGGLSFGEEIDSRLPFESLPLAFIRAFSPFQPTYVAIGLAFLVDGHRRGGRLVALLPER